MRGGRETTGEARMRYAFCMGRSAAAGAMCSASVDEEDSRVAVAAEAYCRA